MAEYALQFGYVGLFIFTALASTLFAAPADVLVLVMPQIGYNTVGVGLVAVAGGYVGNLVNYAAGRYGRSFFLTRFMDQESRFMARAESLYDRYGRWSLLLSGLPFIGDPLTLVAGVMETRIGVFTVLVLIGKIAKVWLLLGIVTWAA